MPAPTACSFYTQKSYRYPFLYQYPGAQQEIYRGRRDRRFFKPTIIPLHMKFPRAMYPHNQGPAQDFGLKGDLHVVHRIPLRVEWCSTEIVFNSSKIADLS